MKNRSNFLMEVKYSKKLKNNILYIAIFVLWLATVKIIGKSNGGSLVFLLGFLMSGITCLSTKLLPNEREGTLTQFKISFSGFLLWILMMYVILTFASKDGITVTIINNMYYITMFMVPVGFIVWEASKIVKLNGIGKSRQETLEYYKDHGNDGHL